MAVAQSATLTGQRALVTGALAIGLAACSAQTARWEKKGVSEAQRKADLRYCRQRAGDYDFLRPGRQSSERVNARSRGETYRWCLEGLGYSRGGTDKPK